MKIFSHPSNNSTQDSIKPVSSQQKRAHFVFLIIPFIILGLTALLIYAKGPYWLGQNSDPSYIYLLNSLYLLDHITPIFTEHPGITLEVLGAVVIKLIHWPLATKAILQNVFLHPEVSLTCIHAVSIAFYLLSLIWVGYYAYQKSKNMLFALLIQANAFVFLTLKSSILPVVTNVNAELPLITIINLYIIGLLKVFYDEENMERMRSATLWGIICALGMATKFTFLLLLLAPIILLKGWRAKFVFILSFSLFFLILMAPLYPRYEKIISWIRAILVNEGTHGSGKIGFDFHFYRQSLWWMIKQFPGYFLFNLLCFFVLFKKLLLFPCDKNQRRRSQFLFTLNLICFGQFLLIAKQAFVHYMAPTLGLYGLIMALLCPEITQSKPLDLQRVYKLFILAIVILSFQTIIYAKQLRELSTATVNFSKKIYSKYKDCIICGYYRSSSPEFALEFGDDAFGFDAYHPLLKTIYPSAYFLNLWTNTFHDFEENYTYEKLKEKNSCILLYGSRVDFPSYLKVEEIEVGPTERVYKVLDSTILMALAHYVAAKNFEASRDYQKAIYHAIISKLFGYPRIDEYLETLIHDGKARKHGEIGTMNIEITGLKNNLGKLKIDVHNSEKNFFSTTITQPPYISGSSSIVDNRVYLSLANIPYGDYAIRVFHDENENGILDKNIFGQIIEDYGLSNNVDEPYYTSRFDKTKLNFAQKEITVGIQMKHMRRRK